MIKLYVNNKEVFVPKDSTVLEACTSIGIEVPRFCFHQRLSVAGNCRMCLIELEKAPKPIASCTFPVTNNMRVFTNTPLVKKARENVLEFLLINHPLDCPICDQGGECDLQDQTLFLGNDKSRFFEFKRSVEDKNCSPLIKTIMTRCIHCTRCVRFMTDIAGIEDFGTTNRGRKSEIGTYIRKIVETELAGNVIDLCPVGALTSKIYAFTARPWELRSAETIDFSDGWGSNIKVDFKESEIVRVLPRLNENLNEEWISDKARFNFDALKIQRIVNPFLKKENGQFSSISLEYGVTTFQKYLFDAKLNLMFSADLDLAALHKIKTLTNLLGIKKVGFYKRYLVNTDYPEDFSFNIKPDKISTIDCCLIIGSNIRFDASALNLKLRKRFKSGLSKIATLGVPFNLSYKAPCLGITLATLIRIAEGKHSFCKDLRRSKKPMFILGGNTSKRYDFFGLEKALFYIKKRLICSESEWNPFCLLAQEANQFAGLFLGVNNTSFVGKNDLLVLSGNQKKEDFNHRILENQVIFLGTHGSEFLLKADLVLPIKTVFEVDGLYMNALGLVQKTKKISKGPNLVKDYSKIIENILSSKQVASGKKGFAPCLVLNKNFKKSDFSNIFLKREKILGKSILSRNPFLPNATDFYLSGAISRFSFTMAKCSSVYRTFYKNFSI